ncbi:MAG: DUF2849 domain-containing protein [Alphaproteobacteria bacterium]|nr:DUF2849 domain-containing protein [Alphaproteobacteria bacterium]
MPKRVITANRLVDGAVVWRDGAGRWREEIDHAAASDDDETVARMLAGARTDEAAGVVIGPYEVEVEQAAVSRKLLPTHLRERIRAGGPTVVPN